MPRSSKKYFVIRFDIDTYVCLTQGVPKLLRFARQEHILFSFFINMGQAVSRRLAVSNILGNKSSVFRSKYKKSNINKLGVLGYLKSAIINPYVGKKNCREMRELVDANHDLGLHGGQNHALWHRQAGTWLPDRLREEIRWGMAELAKFQIDDVISFASPGWNSPAGLPQILSEFGFKIIADQHGNDCQEIKSYKIKGSNTLASVPTNLLGEPGGIGYIEYLRTRHLHDGKMLEQFAEDLNHHPKIAVMYDHPSYVGRMEIEFLHKIVSFAHKQGYRIVTLREAVERSCPTCL